MAGQGRAGQGQGQGQEQENGRAGQGRVGAGQGMAGAGAGIWHGMACMLKCHTFDKYGTNMNVFVTHMTTANVFSHILTSLL